MTDDEAIEVYRRANYWGVEGGGGGCQDGRSGTACRKRRATTGGPKYGGLEVSEARRLRELENENSRLKRLLSDTMLDNVALKDLLTKKW
jgi:hypothetical protein